MDAETKAALVAENARMEAAYLRVLERESTAPTVMNDGVCHIVRVNTDVFSPAIAEVSTDLRETLAVFDKLVLARCQRALRENRQVRTELRRSPDARWIHAVYLFPLDEAVWPCANCHLAVERAADGVYRCLHCHYVMKVK